MNSSKESPDEFPIQGAPADNNQTSPALEKDTDIDQLINEAFAKDPSPQSPDSSSEESQ